MAASNGPWTQQSVAAISAESRYPSNFGFPVICRNGKLRARSCITKQRFRFPGNIHGTTENGEKDRYYRCSCIVSVAQRPCSRRDFNETRCRLGSVTLSRVTFSANIQMNADLSFCGRRTRVRWIETSLLFRPLSPRYLLHRKCLSNTPIFQ